MSLIAVVKNISSTGVFWLNNTTLFEVTSCGLIEVYRRFGGTAFFFKAGLSLL
jgi:hypothetical protein